MEMKDLLFAAIIVIALILYIRHDLYHRAQVDCTGPCGGSGGRNYNSPLSKKAFGNCQ